MNEKLHSLAERITTAGKLIANDHIAKEYNLGNGDTDTIIIKSDSGYEAIYIGNISSESTDGYMCLYSNNTHKRNSFPKTEIIAELLECVVNKSKLITGNGKAAYFDWEEFGGIDKQLEYFSKVVCNMAGITEVKGD